MAFDINISFILVKLVSSFLILLVYIKISGVSSLAPSNASDAIGNMVIGAMVGETIMNDSVSNLESIVIVVFWAGLILLVRYLKSHSNLISLVLDGRRIQLMKKGTILPRNFSKAQIALGDFQITLHQQGINNLHEIDDIWFEPNGRLTVEKKGEKDYAIPIVLGGLIQNENLAVIKKDEQWFEEELKSKGYKTIDDIFYAEWVDGRIWFYPYIR